MSGFVAVVLVAAPAHGDGSDERDGSVTVTDADVMMGFTDSGDTTSASDSFDTCVSGTGGRDVFYRYSPAGDIALTLDLCESTFDTVLYVLELGPSGEPDPSDEFAACNDDACPYIFASQIESVTLLGGRTYDIAVDGYVSGAAGSYTLAITRACAADLDGSGVVDFVDLITVLGTWGRCATGACPSDMDADGWVTFSDLVAVLSAWGACG